SWLPFLARPPSDSPKPESQSLAGFIQEALVARTRSVDRGTQTKQFFVIANVTSPAVLIEGGFLTNKEDVSKLASEDYRDQLTAAVRRYQIRNGLQVTGELNDETLQSLGLKSSGSARQLPRAASPAPGAATPEQPSEETESTTPAQPVQPFGHPPQNQQVYPSTPM